MRHRLGQLLGIGLGLVLVATAIGSLRSCEGPVVSVSEYVQTHGDPVCIARSIEITRALPNSRAIFHSQMLRIVGISHYDPSGGQPAACVSIYSKDQTLNKALAQFASGTMTLNTGGDVPIRVGDVRYMPHFLPIEITVAHVNERSQITSEGSESYKHFELER